LEVAAEKKLSTLALPAAAMCSGVVYMMDGLKNVVESIG
jgi:hypothetical protein